MRTVRRVYDEERTPLVRGFRDARDVAHHPFVGGGSDHHGFASRFVQPCSNVIGTHAAAYAELAHHGRHDAFKTQFQPLCGVEDGAVAVPCHKHSPVTRRRERGKQRRRAPAGREEGSSAPPQARDAREHIPKHSVRGVEVVKTFYLGDVESSAGRGKPRKLAKIAFVSRHMHGQHILPAELDKH